MHLNEEVIDALRNLTSKDLVILTKLKMMRGFDYKSNKIGIDLLIARDFPTTRDYVQGLGRVGRYSEPSGRYKWKSNH